MKTASNDSSIQINLKTIKDLLILQILVFQCYQFKLKLYLTKRNIISSTLIDPYINGNLENADFYFEDMNRIKSFHLDLAMLTQGWSKYKWDTIKEGAQNLIIPFDKVLPLAAL